MKSDRYWAKRAEQRMYGYQKRADKTANDVAKAYAKATNEINTEIRKIFNTYRLNHGLTEAEARKLLNKLPDNAKLADLKAVVNKIPDPETRQEILAQIDAPAYAYRMKRFEALQQDIDSKTQELADFEQKTGKVHLIDTMQDAYYRTAFDVQKGVGIAFPVAQMPLSRIEEILANNWSGKLFSKRIWGRAEKVNKQIKQELLTGFMTGRSYRKTAQAIQNDMAVGAMEARRLVRTESTYVACMAETESAKAMGVKKLKFVATLDMRTSAICQAHDGNLVDVDNAQPGYNIPPLHPWCRSTTIMVIDEALMKDWKRRACDPKTGKTYEVPADMTYAEWKESIDEKYGVGTFEVARKKEANKVRDKAQYERYKSVLGAKNTPKSLAKFQNLKYNNSEGWDRLMRNKKLFDKIDSTEGYSAEYKEKLKQTYQYFKDNGYEFKEHAVNRVLGQKTKNKKQTFTKEEALEVLRKKPNYIQDDGNYVKFYHNIAIVQAADTDEVISVIWKENIRADWKEV